MKVLSTPEVLYTTDYKELYSWMLMHSHFSVLCSGKQHNELYGFILHLHHLRSSRARPVRPDYLISGECVLLHEPGTGRRQRGANASQCRIGLHALLNHKRRLKFDMKTHSHTRTRNHNIWTMLIGLADSSGYNLNVKVMPVASFSY